MAGDGLVIHQHVGIVHQLLTGPHMPGMPDQGVDQPEFSNGQAVPGCQFQLTSMRSTENFSGPRSSSFSSCHPPDKASTRRNSATTRATRCCRLMSLVR